MGKRLRCLSSGKLNPKKWHDRKKVIGNSPEVKSFNRYLDKLYNQVHEVYEKSLLERQPVSAARIKNLLLGNEMEEEITLLYLVKYHNEHMAAGLAIFLANSAIDWQLLF